MRLFNFPISFNNLSSVTVTCLFERATVNVATENEVPTALSELIEENLVIASAAKTILTLNCPEHLTILSDVSCYALNMKVSDYLAHPQTVAAMFPAGMTHPSVQLISFLSYQYDR